MEREQTVLLRAPKARERGRVCNLRPALEQYLVCLTSVTDSVAFVRMRESSMFNRGVLAAVLPCQFYAKLCDVAVFESLYIALQGRTNSTSLLQATCL